MKRRLTAALLVLAALGLTGCSGRPAPDEQSDRVYQSTQRLDDGRSVTCLVYRSGYAGGLSCDWAGAR